MNYFFRSVVSRVTFCGVVVIMVSTIVKADGVVLSQDRKLCTSNEDTLFSCGISQNRIVSVCASKKLTSNEGYIQYRFGKRSHLEIEFPKDAPNMPNWRANVLAGTAIYSGGGGAYLRFKNEPYSYVPYSAVGRGWGEKKGVMVMKGEAMVAFHRCIGSYQSKLGGALRDSAGLSQDPTFAELPPP